MIRVESNRMAEDEFDRLVRDEVAATLERAGFATVSPDELQVEVTDSFERRLGECRLDRQSVETDHVPEIVIRIARRLFQMADEERWRDTVRHEVAHAHVLAKHGDDVAPHGEEWKAAARRAGADPRARYEGGAGLVDSNYVLACPNGCYERSYLQRSKRVKHPWRYACPECETTLISHDVDAPPDDPTPGHCYVASISWTAPVPKDEDPDANYRLACPNGCVTWPYQRRAKRVKKPWLYACPECDTKLVSYDVADPPVDPEPGTCHVASIPWNGPRYVHTCPNGCFETAYRDPQPQTRRPSRYRCEECGEPTVSHAIDEDSRSSDPNPDPG